MSRCVKCGGEMAVLFTSTYCKNECTKAVRGSVESIALESYGLGDYCKANHALNRLREETFLRTIKEITGGLK